MNANKWILSAAASTAVILAQVIVTQWMWISNLSAQASINAEARSIAADQIQDLMMQIENLRSQQETVAVQQFVAGAVAAYHSPDRFSQVWHDGYDRGAAVQKYAAETEKKTAYTKETP